MVSNEADMNGWLVSFDAGSSGPVPSVADAERAPMTRDDDVGSRKNPLASALERRLIGGEWVDLGRPVGAPPQVRHRVDGVIGLDEECDVLLGVARRQPELGIRCEVVAVAVVIEPQVVAVASPEVDHFGVGKQRNVHRVVRVVVRERDVRHVRWFDAQRCQRVEDQGALRDHAWVRDDQRVAVTDQHHRRGRVGADIAGVEQVDGGHSGGSVGPDVGTARTGIAAWLHDAIGTMSRRTG